MTSPRRDVVGVSERVACRANELLKSSASGRVGLSTAINAEFGAGVVSSGKCVSSRSGWIMCLQIVWFSGMLPLS